MGDTSVNTCCYVLLFDNIRVIMTEYLCRYKGGRCDLDGRKVTDSRGGSQENPQNTIYRTKVSEKWGYTCNQTGRWYMAGERVRCKGLSRKADVQTRGTLNLAISPVAPRKSPVAVQDSSGFPMTMLPCCHFTTSGNGVEGEYFMDNWNDWYAARETVRVPAIKIPQKPLTITGFLRDIVRRYAAQDHVSEQDYLDMLILKDQYERRDRALLD